MAPLCKTSIIAHLTALYSTATRTARISPPFARSTPMAAPPTLTSCTPAQTSARTAPGSSLWTGTWLQAMALVARLIGLLGLLFQEAPEGGLVRLSRRGQAQARARARAAPLHPTRLREAEPALAAGALADLSSTRCLPWERYAGGAAELVMVGVPFAAGFSGDDLKNLQAAACPQLCSLMAKLRGSHSEPWVPGPLLWRNECRLAQRVPPRQATRRAATRCSSVHGWQPAGGYCAGRQWTSHPTPHQRMIAHVMFHFLGVTTPTATTTVPNHKVFWLYKYRRAILLVLCGVAWTGYRYAYLTSPDGTELLWKFRSCAAAQDTQKHAPVRWFIPTNLSVGYDLSKNSSFHARGLGKFTRGPDGLAFWDSKWASMWFWWAHQLLNSPQRVHSYEDADFVFVPVCWGDCDGKDPTVHANDVFQRLSEPGVLPYLGKLPHLVVFAYALPDYYLTLPEFKSFYFVALECMGGCSDHHGSPLLRHVVSMPYISKEHPNICAPQRRFDPGHIVFRALKRHVTRSKSDLAV
jgi:hypothetical protein